MNDREPAADIPPRRMRWIGGAAVAALVGVVVVVVVGRGASTDDIVDASSRSNVAVTTAPTGGDIDAARSQPPSPMTVLALADPNRGAAAEKGTVEVCGLGRVAADRVEALDDIHAARAEAAVAKVIASLRSDADERARATGLYLQRAADIAAASARHGAEARGRCGDDAACLQAAGPDDAARAAAARASTEALARMASASRDPFTYAVAMQACAGGLTVVEAPSCRMLSLAQWAGVDPTNATPWLHVAAAARKRKDSAALDEAMYRVATAPTSRMDGTAMVEHAMAHVPADDFDRIQVEFAIVAASGNWQLPSYSTVTDYCAAAAVRDSNRWQTCDAIAHRFVEQPATVIERRIGIRLGERARWPADQVAALREEDEAMERAADEAFGGADSPDCRTAERIRERQLQVARLGEVGARKAWLVASGRSVAELAAATRADRARRSIAAASAASTAGS